MVRHQGGGRTVDRRRMLKGLGAAVVGTALAGCVGGSSETDGQDATPESGGSGQSGGGDGSNEMTDEQTERQPTQSSRSDYPSGDISLVVPFGAGGGYDAYARIAKPFWEEHLPNDPTVIVENVPGGGGAVGGTQVYNAEADGHTFMHTDGVSAVSVQVGRDVGYDLREMTYIGSVSQAPVGINVANRLGLETWDDLVSKISEINIATQGQGAYGHVLTLLLANVTGAFDFEDLNFVHYNSTGGALSGIERGEADVILSGITSAVTVAKSINADILLAFMPPEMGEQLEATELIRNYATEVDVDQFDEYTQLSLDQRMYVGPPGVPDDVLSIQREAFRNIISDEEFLTKSREADRAALDPIVGEESREKVLAQLEAFNSPPLGDLIRESLT